MHTPAPSKRVNISNGHLNPAQRPGQFKKCSAHTGNRKIRAAQVRILPQDHYIKTGSDLHDCGLQKRQYENK